MTGGRRECTCHVCGQTHPVSDTAIKTSAGYTRKTKQKDEKRGGEKGVECTCHVYGQTHTGNKEGGRAMHKTKKEKRGRKEEQHLKRKGGEYKCTCHVCGQTHKYKGAKILARSCEE